MNSDSAHILQIGLGFWPSKVLLSAVEIGLFSSLAGGSKTGAQLQHELELHPRATYDFLDALVALGLLTREGDGPEGRYANTPDTAVFLDRASPRYLGGVLEMANARLYRHWGHLSEALRTGRAQNESKHTGKSVFESIYADPDGLEGFMGAMTGLSMGSYQTFARSFDFSPYQTMCDVGGATGQLSIICAREHPHLRATTFDLPRVEPIAAKTIADAGLSERVGTAAGDFFVDPLPRADLITMGMVLHDWNLDQKKHLVRAAFDALPPGGAFVAIDHLIDDTRRYNAIGLLMSLNMLIEFGEAFDYTGAQVTEWCLEAGFERVELLPLTGPTSAAVAHKAAP